mmetsp:Transcript_38344/g.108387  ORF Transcript_38344/g.108387 Transcript_38344/m.108387 type:complete len:246 (+) Transcript_38344:274-1011(+)
MLQLHAHLGCLLVAQDLPEAGLRRLALQGLAVPSFVGRQDRQATQLHAQLDKALLHLQVEVAVLCHGQEHSVSEAFEFVDHRLQPGDVSLDVQVERAEGSVVQLLCEPLDLCCLVRLADGHVRNDVDALPPACECEERLGGRRSPSGDSDSPHRELYLEQVGAVEARAAEDAHEVTHLEAEGDHVVAAALYQVAVLLKQHLLGSPVPSPPQPKAQHSMAPLRKRATDTSRGLRRPGPLAAAARGG